MPSDFKTEWIPRYLGRLPTVILDVGAYDGEDSLRFKKEFPSARVLAIEASPINFLRLQQVEGVEVFCCAIGESNGSCRYWHSTSTLDNWSGSGSILEPNECLLSEYTHLRFEPIEAVRKMTLEGFCAEHSVKDFDLLHMDVQGAEGHVLRGLGAHRPKLIYLEILETHHYSGAVSPGGVIEILEGLGYSKQWNSDLDALWVHGNPDRR